jgi:hypothetical protein
MYGPKPAPFNKMAAVCGFFARDRKESEPTPDCLRTGELPNRRPANPASSANPAAFPLSSPIPSERARQLRLKSFLFCSLTPDP